MKYFCLFIFCALLSSCAQSRFTKPSENIKGAFRERVHFYQKKDKDKFFENISKQYRSGYNEFEYQVEDFLYNNSHIQLDFVIEKQLSSGNKKSVELKWYKTYVDRRGNPVKRQGFATLFFNVSGEKAVLINIKGDNPFTQ
ncbi:MAG: hypothetical protein KAS99_05550 [Candidatus Omnitrophica bacterium]|nr:hypothetical protein [Candidatus Omnitrophota bacterium]